MSDIVKFLVVSIWISIGLVRAEAGQQPDDYLKYRGAGISFSIVVGPPSVRHPVRSYKYRQPIVRGCSPRQATTIARRYGIQFPTIYRTAHTMTVVGYKRGHKRKILFSRAPDCHIIG
jgi:hypothetical protein